MKTLFFALALLAFSFTIASAQSPSWKTAGQVVTLEADTLTTSQSLVYTPLKATVLANTKYWFEMHLLDTSSSAAGIKFGIQFPSGTLKARFHGETTGVTAGSWDVMTADTTAGLAYQTQNANNGVVNVYGILDVGSTGGTFSLGELKVTSGGGGLLKYSFMRWGKRK